MLEKIKAFFRKKPVQQVKQPPNMSVSNCRAVNVSEYQMPLATRSMPYTSSCPDNNDFAVSMAIGAATHNGLVGGAIGGNLAGGIAGEIISSTPSAESSHSHDYGSCHSHLTDYLNNHHDTSSHHSHDFSNSCDSGSSSDSGGSWD